MVVCEEVAEELGVFKSYAYKIIQKLNSELKSQGFLTISGRVSKQYLLDRVCYSKKGGIKNDNLQRGKN